MARRVGGTRRAVQGALTNRQNRHHKACCAVAGLHLMGRKEPVDQGSLLTGTAGSHECCEEPSNSPGDG